MKIVVHVINAFSIDGTGGNPAGVVLDADQLSNEKKQLIAAEAGMSETAFVSKSESADFKLDFFTPTKQIPHCGHATIATFWYLKSLNKIKGESSSKETIDGTRKIFFQGDAPFMEQLSPRFEPINNPDSVLESLGIAQSDITHTSNPILGNAGNSFILIRLNKVDVLSLLKPKFELISKISASYDAIGYYVYGISPDKSVIQTRMFAPYYGINEESATGMAAGPLAAFLYPELKQKEFHINQGKHMTPPSESKLHTSLSVDGDVVKSLLVGGSAFIARTMEISI
jgi:PhzF family phenazine biosynthesis protein